MSRRWIVTIVVAVLIVISVIVALLLRPQTPTVTVTVKSSGLVLPHGWAVADDSSILIATNRNFVNYNPKTGASQVLMTDGLLPDKTSKISWSGDKKHAMFDATNQSSFDTLGALAGPSTSDYWWIADFTTKKYIPVGANILSAGWVNNTTYYVVGTPPGTSAKGLYTATLGSTNYKTIVQGTNLLSAFATPSGFLVYSTQDHQGVLTQVTGSEQQTVIINGLTRAPQVNTQGTYAVVMRNTSKASGTDADLSADTMDLVNIQTGKIESELAQQQTTDGSWSTTGTDYYFQGTKSSNIVDVTVGDNATTVSNIELAGQAVSSISRLAPGASNLYLLDSSNQLFVGSTNEGNQVASHTINPVTQDGLIGNNFVIYHYDSTHLYSITVTAVPLAQYVALAEQALQRAGANPDLVDIVIDDETPATRAAEGYPPL